MRWWRAARCYCYPHSRRCCRRTAQAIFARGLAHVPEGLQQDNPADVPAILFSWISELGELVETRSVLRALCRQLGGRVSAAPGAPPPSPAEVVPLVAQLVELERQAFHSREVIAGEQGCACANSRTCMCVPAPWLLPAAVVCRVPTRLRRPSLSVCSRRGRAGGAARGAHQPHLPSLWPPLWLQVAGGCAASDECPLFEPHRWVGAVDRMVDGRACSMQQRP